MYLEWIRKPERLIECNLVIIQNPQENSGYIMYVVWNCKAVLWCQHRKVEDVYVCTVRTCHIFRLIQLYLFGEH